MTETMHNSSRNDQESVLPDVGKPSLFYTILYWFIYLYFNIYYRRFSVRGRENLPAGKPVIFAGNHQNALMDALSILFAAHGKVVFLARADLFRKRFIARMLYFLRILPVYRIRDGISTMGQNEGSFEKAADVLKNGTPLALFPEGNHAGFKRLRSLKKGICRIAFMAIEKSGFTLDLQIVPSGIDYSNYSDPGSRLLVTYGKPIRVAEFIPLYRENPQKALSALRDRLSEALQPLMINISSEENYDTYMAICGLYRAEVLKKRKWRNSHQNRVRVDQEIISKLDDSIEGKSSLLEPFREKNREYQELLTTYGIRDWLIQKRRTGLGSFLFNSLVTLLLAPVYLYGLAINYIPYKLPLQFTKNVKDRVFHSSIHFGIGLLLFPVWHLLLLIVFSLFVNGFWLRLLFALSMPLSGVFTFYYYKYLLKLRGRFRLLRLRLFNRPAFDDLIARRANLLRSIETIVQPS